MDNICYYMLAIFNISYINKQNDTLIVFDYKKQCKKIK